MTLKNIPVVDKARHMKALPKVLKEKFGGDGCPIARYCHSPKKRT